MGDGDDVASALLEYGKGSEVYGGLMREEYALMYVDLSICIDAR